MKFNWGTGIFLFYSIFALTLFWQVYQTTRYDNSLVVDNYYEKDLQYQAHFDRLRNAQSLSEPVRIAYSPAGQQVELHFPAEANRAIGTVQFYRPSNQDFDFVKPLVLDANRTMAIPIQGLVGGRWVVKIEWEAGGNPYYTEQDMMLPQL